MTIEDTYRTFDSIIAEYTFFPAAHRTLSKLHYVKEHKNLLHIRNLNNVCVLYDHSEIKWEMIENDKTYTNSQRLSIIV